MGKWFPDKLFHGFIWKACSVLGSILGMSELLIVFRWLEMFSHSLTDFFILWFHILISNCSFLFSECFSNVILLFHGYSAHTFKILLIKTSLPDYCLLLLNAFFPYLYICFGLNIPYQRFFSNVWYFLPVHSHLTKNPTESSGWLWTAHRMIKLSVFTVFNVSFVRCFVFYFGGRKLFWRSWLPEL